MNSYFSFSPPPFTHTCFLFFKAMEELDGDDVRLSFNGKKAERDIVQVRMEINPTFVFVFSHFAQSFLYK